MKLETLGYNDFFRKSFENYNQDQYQVGRIALEHKHIYRVWTESGELLGDISGKMRFEARGREDYPAVGDWVVVTERAEEKKATIHVVLPRMSKFSRKVAGNEIEEQIVATNIDVVFLVTSLNQDFNVRRLERYLVLTWESGATPVIVLSKADLCEELEEKIAEVEQIAIGVPIFTISAHTGAGMEELASQLQPGMTVALLGSSGVGKSTIANYLVGKDVLKTKEIREEDGRGKHTTTHRELLALPCGAVLIDTPGMREIQLWDAEDGMSGTFEDVEVFTSECQFSNCKHISEPQCGVKAALTDGRLTKERFESYRKLQKELVYLASKEDKRLAAANKEKWKTISKMAKTKAW